MDLESLLVDKIKKGGSVMGRGKYMVYDTESEDIIFHDTLESAEKDYNDAVKDIGDNGIVYFFEVKKQSKDL